MAVINTETYKGHTIRYWTKSFSVDDGPVLLLPNRPGDVRAVVDAIEACTKKQIRIMLGAS